MESSVRNSIDGLIRTEHYKTTSIKTYQKAARQVWVAFFTETHLLLLTYRLYN